MGVSVERGEARPGTARLFRTLAALVCGATLVASCAPPTRTGSGAGAPAEPVTAGPKRAVAAIKGNPPTLSTAIDGAGAGNTDGLTEVQSLLHSGLSAVDGSGRLVGRLIADVPTTENGLWRLLADGRMETTFRIKPNARWHDGSPLTAQDLVLTMEVALDRRVPMSRGPMYMAIESAEATDASTFVAKWKQPYIEADRLFTSGVLPMPRHLLETAYREDPVAFVGVPYWTSDFVGTGPFKLHEWELGSFMVIRASDTYILGRPKLDELEIRFILDSTTMVANMLAGAVDLNLGRGLSLEQALQAQAQWGGRGHADVEVQNWSALYPQFIDPNPAILANANFRRALMHAINRQELTDLLQNGLGPVADIFLIPNSEEHESVKQHILRHDYDPRRAVQLLEQVGLTRGADGSFRDASGQPLSVQIRTTRDDLRERGMHSIGEYWRSVGIAMEPSLIATQAQQARDYRATRPGFEFTRTPAAPTGYLSSGVPRPENNFNGDNRPRYSNAELDSLIERYYVTVPKRERFDFLGQIVRHITQELVAMGIFYTVVPTLISSRMQQAAMPIVQGGNITWNAHEWDVR